MDSISLAERRGRQRDVFPVDRKATTRIGLSVACHRKLYNGQSPLEGIVRHLEDQEVEHALGRLQRAITRPREIQGPDARESEKKLEWGRYFRTGLYRYILEIFSRAS
ncbi:hypothetical protein HGRIS_009405 [Hohenbuehelia grisea]|uniref:Uncharacterized protein n=1 Tax=Hohenbuehelia grisea TaxID=104357 RepID=A0ABR3J1G0_9AGAR